MRPLAPLFSAVVSAVLGASALAACSSTSLTNLDDGGTDGSTSDGGAFGAAACSESALLEGLTGPEAFDYIEIRRETAVPSPTPDGGDAGVNATVDVLAKKGELCAKASDKTRCLENYAAIHTIFDAKCDGAFSACVQESAIVNQGDKFSSFHQNNGIGPFLAPIDSPTEAALVARLQGYKALCDATTPRVLSGGGYEVKATVQDACLGEKRGYVLEVSSTGILTEKSKEVISPPQGVCGRRPEGRIRPA